jgi:hypothetical protein
MGDGFSEGGELLWEWRVTRGWCHELWWQFQNVTQGQANFHINYVRWNAEELIVTCEQINRRRWFFSHIKPPALLLSSLVLSSHFFSLKVIFSHLPLSFVPFPFDAYSNSPHEMSTLLATRHLQTRLLQIIGLLWIQILNQ